MDDHAMNQFFKHEKTNWFFLSRNEDVKMLINKYLPVKLKIRILDAGCGTGATMELLKEFGTVDGIDLSQTAIDFCKGRVLNNVRLGDVCNLPYADNTYDLITGLGILEHTDNPDLNLSEFRRVLKDDGIVIMTIPAYNFLWTTADDHYMHKKRYVVEEVQDLLDEAGFKTVKLSYRAVLILFPFLLKVIFFGRKRDVVVKAGNKTGGLLLAILRVESFFLRFINYPFGASIIAVARK